MNIPTIEFPVAHAAIPAEVEKLRDFINAKRAEIDVASAMLAALRRSCGHKGAQRGSNERDGSWMQCSHCGESR